MYGLQYGPPRHLKCAIVTKNNENTHTGNLIPCGDWIDSCSKEFLIKTSQIWRCAVVSHSQSTDQMHWVWKLTHPVWQMSCKGLLDLLCRSMTRFHWGGLVLHPEWSCQHRICARCLVALRPQAGSWTGPWPRAWSLSRPARTEDLSSRSRTPAWIQPSHLKTESVSSVTIS